MRNDPGLEMELLMRSIATDKSTIDESFSKSKANVALEKTTEIVSTELPTDDGLPPALPTGVVLTPFMGAVAVNWDQPPRTDYVVISRVEVTPAAGSGEPQTIHETTDIGITLSGLTGDLEHTFRVEHEDRWGQVSGWSAPLTATPTLTAAQQVDFSRAQILGELGYSNIEVLRDELKIEQGLIKTHALAAGNAAFINAWVEDLAIESAKVKSMSADKIDAGSVDVAISLTTGGSIDLVGSGSINMAAGSLNVTGGSINVASDTAGNRGLISITGSGRLSVRDSGGTTRVRVSTVGVELSPTAQTGDDTSLPAGAIGRGIFPVDANWGGMWLYENATFRGFMARAAGGGTSRGRYTIIATAGPNTIQSDRAFYGHMVVTSNAQNFLNAVPSAAGVNIQNSLVVGGPILATDQIQSTANFFTTASVEAKRSVVADESIVAGGVLQTNGGPNNAGRLSTTAGVLEISASGRIDLLALTKVNNALQVNQSVSAASVDSTGPVDASLLRGPLNPHYIFGTGAGSWAFIAANSSRDFSYGASVPHFWRVLWSATAGYENSRTAESSTALNVVLLTSLGVLRVFNNSGGGLYFNVATWRLA